MRGLKGMKRRLMRVQVAELEGKLKALHDQHDFVREDNERLRMQLSHGAMPMRVMFQGPDVRREFAIKYGDF